MLNPPPNTPEPQGDQGADVTKLVRNYMFRQYWLMRWLILIVVSFMSIYTISFERWVPLIGLTGLSSFFFVMLGIIAGGVLMTAEFMKAIRAKQLGTSFDWTKVRYAAWGVVLGNVVMLYWIIVMVYISWFAENPVNIQ